MNKYIVTTTINKPTEAIIKFAQKKDWIFIIIGDKKTPHELYKKLERKYSNVIYMSCEMQEKKYKRLSKIIGWNSIQRRNIGFVESYNMGAEIIATVDDDNIPYSSWGKNILVNKEVYIDCYETKIKVFDPLSITKANYIWHRGYPIELIKDRLNVKRKGKIKRKVLVQADLWNGDPDIDAIARLTFKPIVKFTDIKKPYCSNKITPFNSQNTFLSRDVFPYYAVYPHIGRMDDIWGAYIMQYYYPDSVIFNKASVYQKRNKQDIILNLEKEIFGHRYSLKLIQSLKNYSRFLPEKTKQFIKIYRKEFKKN